MIALSTLGNITKDNVLYKFHSPCDIVLAVGREMRKLHSPFPAARRQTRQVISLDPSEIGSQQSQDLRLQSRISNTAKKVPSHSPITEHQHISDSQAIRWRGRKLQPKAGLGAR